MIELTRNDNHIRKNMLLFDDSRRTSTKGKQCSDRQWTQKTKSGNGQGTKITFAG